MVGYKYVLYITATEKSAIKEFDKTLDWIYNVDENLLFILFRIRGPNSYSIGTMGPYLLPSAI